jgi:2-polyprenyl-3-methyl-5-hydroxy-6-metoxy-1,4-benzoquinol methylase
MSALRLSLRQRGSGPERMDDPACDETMLLRTVDQFASLNRRISRHRSILSRWVLDDMARADPARAWHLVDLGAGGCDIAVWLLRTARRRGLRLKVTAIDADPRIVRHARRRCNAEPGLEILRADLHAMDGVGPVDYLFANHLLHHLPDADIPSILARMHATARQRWLVSDIHRSIAAYAGFHLLGRMYRKSFVLEDGLRSIRRGFVPAELDAHLQAAGLAGRVKLLRLVPARLLLIGDAVNARKRSSSPPPRRSP